MLTGSFLFFYLSEIQKGATKHVFSFVVFIDTILQQLMLVLVYFMCKSNVKTFKMKFVENNNDVIQHKRKSENLLLFSNVSDFEMFLGGIIFYLENLHALQEKEKNRSDQY